MHSLEPGDSTWSEAGTPLNFNSVFGHRTWHAAQAVPKFGDEGELLLVFGGETVAPSLAGQAKGDRTATNTLLIFDPEFEVWYEVQTQGARPCPRSGHAMTRVGADIFVFGGCRRTSFLNDLTVRSHKTKICAALLSLYKPKTWRAAHETRC